MPPFIRGVTLNRTVPIGNVILPSFPAKYPQRSWQAASEQLGKPLNRDGGGMPERHILFVVFPGALFPDPSGPMAAFEISSETVTDQSASYRVTVASTVGGPLRTSAGIEIMTTALAAERKIDTLVVGGGRGVHDATSNPILLSCLSDHSRDIRRLCAGMWTHARQLVRQLRGRCVVLASDNSVAQLGWRHCRPGHAAAIAAGRHSRHTNGRHADGGRSARLRHRHLFERQRRRQWLRKKRRPCAPFSVHRLRICLIGAACSPRPDNARN